MNIPFDYLIFPFGCCKRCLNFHNEEDSKVPRGKSPQSIPLLPGPRRDEERLWRSCKSAEEHLKRSTEEFQPL